MGNRCRVGPGLVACRDLRERETLIQESGVRDLTVPVEVLGRGRYRATLGCLVLRFSGDRVYSAFPVHDSFVPARAADVIRELRAGRSHPGLEVMGWGLQVTPEGLLKLGCQQDTLGRARALLAACRKQARARRPWMDYDNPLPFGARSFDSITSAGTAVTPGGTRVSLRTMELLVAAAEERLGRRSRPA